MKCPACGLLNPPSSERCDCGYDFATGQLKQPYVDRAPEIAASTGLGRTVAVALLAASLVLVGLQVWTSQAISRLPPGPPPHGELLQAMAITTHRFHLAGTVIVLVVALVDLLLPRSRGRRSTTLIALVPVGISTASWAVSWTRLPDMMPQVVLGLVGFGTGVLAAAQAIVTVLLRSVRRSMPPSAVAATIALATVVLLWSVAFAGMAVTYGVAA